MKPAIQDAEQAEEAADAAEKGADAAQNYADATKLGNAEDEADKAEMN